MHPIQSLRPATRSFLRRIVYLPATPASGFHFPPETVWIQITASRLFGLLLSLETPSILLFFRQTDVVPRADSLLRNQLIFVYVFYSLTRYVILFLFLIRVTSARLMRQRRERERQRERWGMSQGCRRLFKHIFRAKKLGFIGNICFHSLFLPIIMFKSVKEEKISKNVDTRKENR